jgi:hypothetical protein
VTIVCHFGLCNAQRNDSDTVFCRVNRLYGYPFRIKYSLVCHMAADLEGQLPCGVIGGIRSQTWGEA